VIRQSEWVIASRCMGRIHLLEAKTQLYVVKKITFIEEYTMESFLVK